MPNEQIKAIKVLIVDDSFFMRKILQEILSQSNGAIEVIDTAKNGMEAIEKTKNLKPDVVTLDVEMPRMDGLEALQRIMEEFPTPILMLSSHTGKGTETAIRALELGALDCLAKPNGRLLENVKGIQDELIEKIKLASLCKPRKRETFNKEYILSERLKKEIPSQEVESQIKRPASYIVAVASSTGGPRALNDLFSGLKSHPLTAFVIIQHISIGFTKALATRLGEIGPLITSEAQANECPLGGHAYVAPGGSHLLVEGNPGNYRFALNNQPPRMGVKPSADIFMYSLAQVAVKHCLGVVLTGMGRDGTAGLKEIQSAGGLTFAQDAESCVVYGMPKSAVEAGFVNKQLPLAIMAAEINRFLDSLKET